MNCPQNSPCLRIRPRGERGSMLLELLIAIVVLAIGLGGLLVLMVSAMYTDTRAGNDTSSTMLAEHVLEQLSAPMAEDAGTLDVLDCAQTTWTINRTGAAVGAGSSGTVGGNGAKLLVAPSGTVNIDWTQSYATVPAGYKMKYVACGAGGKQTTYDVRWNIITISPYSRMMLASVRPAEDNVNGGLRYVMPATLRTIGGM